MEDDVILCDSPEPSDNNKCEGKNEDDELRNAFLLNFSLQSKFSDASCLSNEKQKTYSCSEEASTETTSRSRRLPSRRNRTVHSFSRCSFIPISSPAGQQLLKTTKQTISMEYISERQERLDRFCYTPLIVKSNTSRQKIFEKKSSSTNVHCTFKKSHEHNFHIYSFPRRQFVKRRDTTENFLFLNSPLIKQCRPISVRLKKISEQMVIEEQSQAAANTKLNIRLTRHNSLNSHWRISPSSEVVVDTIDLCSSEDDDDESTKVLGSDALTIIKLTHNNNRKSSRRTNDSSKCPSEPESSSAVDNSPVKPLQQSLYIFSNYKANSVFSRCTVDTITNHSLVSSLTTSNTFADTQGQHRKEYNQENCNFSKKLVRLTDWYAHSAAAANTEKSPSNPITTESSSTFDTISSAVQPFNSTGRIISIDLTS